MKELGPYALGQHATARAFLGSVPEQGLNEFLLGRDFGEGQLSGEWQQVQVIARGNTLVHVLNGQVITVTIDDDPANPALQGILSLQLGGSGQVWYRNVYVRHLG